MKHSDLDGPILPLAEPVMLYLDEGEESRRVERLLDAASIEVWRAEKDVSPEYRLPLILHQGGVYQGFDEIEEWLAFLRFLSRERPSSPTFIQEGARRSA